MNIEITKGKAHGVVYAPPSKSLAHRMLICAGMSEGESIIHGIAESQDVLATLDCLAAFGAKYERLADGTTIKIKGVDFRSAVPEKVLSCRESGSTLRFFIPPALLSGQSVMLKGSKTLLSRPMDVYKKLCDENKMFFMQDEESIIVKGKLKAGKYSVVGNISSQFISGLLFALPLADGDSTVSITPPIESRSYIELTLASL